MEFFRLLNFFQTDDCNFLEAGKVYLDSFLAICVPLLYHGTVQQARHDLEVSLERLMAAIDRDQNEGQNADDDGVSQRSHKFPNLRTEDLELLQSFLLYSNHNTSVKKYFFKI